MMSSDDIANSKTFANALNQIFGVAIDQMILIAVIKGISC